MSKNPVSKRKFKTSKLRIKSTSFKSERNPPNKLSFGLQAEVIASPHSTVNAMKRQNQ